MNVADALVEFDRRGIVATVANGRIELRPGTKVDDRLRLALAGLREDLLHVLAIRQAVGGRIMDRPIRPAPPRRQVDDRDYDTSDIDERIPPGWTRRHWIDRLRQLADGCEGQHPARARELRQQADELDRRPMGDAAGCGDQRETSGSTVCAGGLVSENSIFTKGLDHGTTREDSEHTL